MIVVCSSIVSRSQITVSQSVARVGTVASDNVEYTPSTNYRERPVRLLLTRDSAMPLDVIAFLPRTADVSVRANEVERGRRV